MDFLKAEIERKKREMEKKSVFEPEKKYFKRGNLSQKEAEEYLARHNKQKLEEELKLQKKVEEIKEVKDKLMGGKITHRRVSQDDPEGEGETEKKLPVLPRQEVIRRLRDRSEPILLFGETDEEACDRLREIEIEDTDKVEGIRNDFKEAMDKVDALYLKELLQSQGKEEEDEGGSTKSKFDVVLYSSESTYDDLLDIVGKTNKGDIDIDLKLISEFIKVMLSLWGEELNKRPEAVKMSVKGKTEAGTYTQTRTYLKPLQRMLRKQTVTDDIRDSLLKMIKYALQRDYILCNEAYMEMAIGNAPWPIGVTNAGIHARPARENIFSKHVAHVLNDETQRKYIQGLKRLLTKCQQYYPTDPSRSIDYTRRPEDDEQ